MLKETSALGAINWPLVFPTEAGKWEVRRSTATVVDGFLHKISLPGLEIRSGESFGISGLFHILQPTEDPKNLGVAKVTFEAGQILRSDPVGTVDAVEITIALTAQQVDGDCCEYPCSAP